jgi:hypothetical protein
VCEFVRIQSSHAVRCSTLLPNIRPQDPRQCTSAQQINQLEGWRPAASGFALA